MNIACCKITFGSRVIRCERIIRGVFSRYFRIDTRIDLSILKPILARQQDRHQV